MIEAPVVVTGAGGAIGRAVVERLRAQGRKVHGIDRLSPPADLQIDGWTAADLSRVTSLEEAVGLLPAKVGGVVHVAGVIVVKPLDALTAADWDLQFQLNVKVPYFLTVAARPRFVVGAAVVFVSSVSAMRATQDAAGYSATKAAQRNLAASFAADYAAAGIRVNVVCPGLIDTPMTDAMNDVLAERRAVTLDRLREQRVQPIPQGRAGTPGEVADAVAYLMSPNAAYVTGSTLTVAGGVLAGAV